MGFYGNVTNTDKTTFSFDLTYTTRIDMDKNADTDGVFLGRYVLVDYDGEVIKAYYDPNTDRFYNTANFSVSTMITPHEGVIVQNLHDAMSPQSIATVIPTDAADKGPEIMPNAPFSFMASFVP